MKGGPLVKTSVRLARLSEMETLQKIYDQGQKFQIKQGNRHQWAPGYPGLAQIKRDILKNHLFVLVDERDHILAAMALIAGIDPTYQHIEGRGWLDETSYHTVHRFVSAGLRRHSGRDLLKWAISQCGNIRIDTHKANLSMLQLLEDLGFTHCGRIYLLNGDPREAFQIHLDQGTSH